MADYDDNTTPGLETKDELGDNPAALVRRWLLELRLADKREREWRKTAQGVLELYRGETVKKNSFNILWSNTETMLPAIYSTPPKPDVRRRYKDGDKLGKVVSEVVSRALEFSIDTYDFDSLARADVLDMLLVGRGISRVRYVPSMKQVGLDPEYHDEDKRMFRDKPRHDWTSHYADAFRYACLVWREEMKPKPPSPARYETDLTINEIIKRRTMQRLGE